MVREQLGMDRKLLNLELQHHFVKVFVARI